MKEKPTRWKLPKKTSLLLPFSFFSHSVSSHSLIPLIATFRSTQVVLKMRERGREKEKEEEGKKRTWGLDNWIHGKQSVRRRGRWKVGGSKGRKFLLTRSKQIEGEENGEKKKFKKEKIEERERSWKKKVHFPDD